LGNEQGKIIVLVGFLVGGVVQLTQKLQWHVHAVSSLKVDGAYLYSAGEEGVVVVWHLRENKKDFLPRIGSAISNLQLIDSSVYCFLADSSLKAIDLSNDKAILHYKLILNPNTQLIAASSKKLSKSLLVRASHRADRLFLRAGPGRVQEIDLFSGINNEHAVISRNYVSRLDQHLPAPHQLTDICLSKDGTILAAAVEGIGCRSLRFFAL
jgi:NET1-associated nuclear protein 1 (U3 small nucleolar RNA-associated protein 17)